MSKRSYGRILLKLSGEALLNGKEMGSERKPLDDISFQIKELNDLGIEIAIVVGGGNILRGSQAQQMKIKRVYGDYIGMLATIVNGIALFQVLENIGCRAHILNSFSCGPITQFYTISKALRYLGEGSVVILTGGMGNPYFTTDSAAAIRAIELEADIFLKATKVDGVYVKDPLKYEDAIKLPQVSYGEILERRLKVIDEAAILLCSEAEMPICVFDIFTRLSIKRAVLEKNVGSLINGGKV